MMTEVEKVQAEKTVPVYAGKLKTMEEQAENFNKCRDLAIQIESIQGEMESLKEELKDLRKQEKSMVSRLNRLIIQGPEKPDPQQRLPFTDAESPSVASRLENTLDEGIPKALLGLDLNNNQKEELASVGCNTLEDVASLAAGKWANYPNGLLSLKRFNSINVQRLLPQLPELQTKPNELSAKIRLLTYTGTHQAAKPDTVWNARLLHDGRALVVFDGKEIAFNKNEFEVVK